MAENQENPEGEASTRNEAREASSKLKGLKLKAMYLMSKLKVEDVNEDNINDGSIRERLEEIRELEIFIGTNTFFLTDTYSEVWGKTIIDELNSEIKTLQTLVKKLEEEIERK